MFLSNPELIRNVRAHLRGDRMLAVAGICAVLSLAVGFSMAYSAGSREWGLEFLRLAVGAQAFVLLIMGGLIVLQAIQWEKHANTFDFQRLTRLSSVELALGKLLGAPILAYFIALCLMPAAIVGAAAGHARLSFVLAGYAVLVLGAITFHAFALLLSLVIARGIGGAAVLLFLLYLPTVGGEGSRFFLNLGPLSPYFATNLVGQTTWTLDPASAQVGGASTMTDLLFGWPVHHVPVLLVLYATFAAWFLLPVVRNIKRDPAVYEIFTPWQALGLGVYVNFIVVAFVRWSVASSLGTQAALLAFNIVVFSGLGVALLRTREWVRWLSERGRSGTGWAAAAWPASYVLAGTLLVGLGVISILQVLPQRGEWDIGLALLKLTFCALWIARDILFVQWMNLRGGRRPLLMSLLYLGAFYICATVIVTAFHVYRTPEGAAWATVLLPGSVLGISSEVWIDHRLLWVSALAVEVLPVALFVVLQHRVRTGLTPRRSVAVPAA